MPEPVAANGDHGKPRGCRSPTRLPPQMARMLRLRPGAGMYGASTGRGWRRLGIPGGRSIVQPVAVWRGSYGKPRGGAAGKEAGGAMAREILREPERAMTHDEADAVLLSWWGWRNILNNSRAESSAFALVNNLA